MKLHILNDGTHNVESTQYVIIACLKSKPMGKRMKRIPGSRLLISSLPGSTSRMHLESLGKLHDSTSVLKALPAKLEVKRH